MKTAALLLMLTITLLSGVARAQSREDVAKADALFDAAKALLDKGAFADACPKLAESRRLAPGIGVSLYLGECYEHVGKTASAWNEFRAAEALARARHDKRADVAHARAERLEAKLTRLTVTIAPDVARANATITRDGAALPNDQWGIASVVDPGDHTFVVAASGHEPRTLTVRVEPSAPSTTLTIDALGPAIAPPASPKPTKSSDVPVPPLPVAVAPMAPPRSAMTSRRWIALGIAGAGIVGIGVGALFASSAKSKLDESNQGPCDASDHCTANGLTMRQDAGSAANVATAAFGLGALAIVGGVVLYFTAPKASGLDRVGLSPLAAERATGLSLHAAW